MKVHIVTEPGSWILSRMSKEVSRAIDASVGESVDPEAYINYFVNYALFQRTETISIGYFTHFDPKFEREWKEAENSLDAAVYMADQYRPKTKIRRKIFPSGLDVKLDTRKLIVGVSGRVYEGNRRKGENEIVAIDKKIGGDICWKFMGSGWDQIGIENEYSIKDWKSDDDARDFYRSIDVLLCMATLEGGPVPNIEAVKCGKPLISKKVGNYELWGDLACLVRSHRQASEELKKMIQRKKARYDLCEKNWDWFGVEHKKFFKEVFHYFNGKGK